MNIFIAGCARSGTSLTRGLMGCFEGVYAPGGHSDGEESPASGFERHAGKAPHIILKRTADCHQTLPQLRTDVELLYCVRHPYDVLTSSHRLTQEHRRFHVSRKRFIAEYKAFCQLRMRQPQRRVFVLRYEDLILNPDDTQQRIAAHFGLLPLYMFSRNRAGTELHAGSIEKWRDDPDLLAYFTSFRRSFRTVVRSFCRDFGYVLPELPGRKVSMSTRLRNFFRPPKSDGPQRLRGNPIIRPSMLPGDDGANINGPSLITAPEWLPGRMGKYYLYFADHRGTYIRLAYADRLEGPWSIHRQGTLKLSQAPMCREHIASPDVHVDEGSRQIRMYFHGPASSGPGQNSFVAVSSDGVGFSASAEVLAGPYLRCIRWNGRWLGVDMDGYFYQSKDGLTDFKRSPERAFTFRGGITLRHVALRIVGSTLEIYYTRRGDIPERIWRCFVDLVGDWTMWSIRDAELVLAPEMRWEGANRPTVPSRPGPARRREHALRDPAIFVEDATSYLLYSVAGEAGIAIAALR
jgi:hypothetical protein